MPLARLGGELLRVDGTLATSCCCDIPEQCVYVRYQYPVWDVGATPFPPTECFPPYVPFLGCDVVLSEQVISKPDAFSGKRTTVTITGLFDDSIAVNGNVLGNCRPGGDVNMTFTLAAEEAGFRLGAVDSFGSCAHGTLAICFSTGNPLP